MSVQNLNNSLFPKLKALRHGDSDTPTNALLNMLRKDPNNSGDAASKPRVNLNRFMLDKVSREISQEIVDSDAIMQLLPDLELVETVYIGSIIDPKAMSDSDLTFANDQAIFDSELSKLLIEPVEKYFKQDYKINEHLDLILRDCLFRKGASVLAVLPENVLDTLINGNRQVSIESISSARSNLINTSKSQLGFLGSPKENPETVSVEGNDYTTHVDNRICGDSNLLITDNPFVLKLPKTDSILRESRVLAKFDKFKVSNESTREVHKWSNQEIDRLYSATLATSEPVQVITSPEFNARPSVGHPLILPLPVESVVPIYKHGRPFEHVGYFILVDQHGYPLSKDSTRDFYGELQSSWKNGGTRDNSSEILRLTREAMGGSSNNQNYEINEINETYNSILINELNNRLRNGMYDEELDIGLTNEISRIMLYRNWKAKTTQLVFVPVELITYIAFDYNLNGVGETLLSRSKMVATMRTTLLFAEAIGGMRNAVGRKRVNITLDPDDVDPEQTISNVQSNIMESAHRAFPLAAPDPTQAMDHLIRSGFDFAINTNGADYAETKVEYDDYNTNVNAGNPDLSDRLRRIHISGFGIPPEKVDPMSSPDFATSIVHNDLVMSRRIKEKQKTFCKHLTKLVKTFCKHSSLIRNEMYRLVTTNVKMITDPALRVLTVEQLVDNFIESIVVSLPEPDNTQYERQIESMEIYERILDKGLEAIVTEELFPEDLLAIPGLADKVMKQTRASFIRQFMARNNILPELNILTEMDGDTPAFSLLDFINVQQGTMGRAFLEYAKGSMANAKKLKEDYAAVIQEAQGNDGMDSFSDGGGGDSFDTQSEPGNMDDEFAFDEPVDETQSEDEPQPEGLDNPMAEAEADESADEEPDDQSLPEL